MDSTIIYSYFKNLINNKFYKNKEDILVRLKAFYENGIITKEQYDELVALTEEKYKDNK